MVAYSTMDDRFIPENMYNHSKDVHMDTTIAPRV
jgi:hypothetical protein